MALDGYSGTTMSRQAMRAELLTSETEVSLALAWRDQRDQRALHRLVMAHMRLAISVAAKFRRYGAPMGDLIQEANLGLMKAAEKFDPERGVRFSTYAVWWIKASVQDYVMRNWSLVRTGSTSSQKSLFFNMRRIEAKLVREAAERGETLDGDALRRGVAEDLGVPLADVEMMAGRLSGSDLSLNAPQGAEGEGREWIELLEDENPDGTVAVEADHDRKQLQGRLAAALAGLNARERHIVIERRLNGEGRTLDSLGVEMGLSKERIRQLEAAAYAKLRKRLESEWPEVRGFL